MKGIGAGSIIRRQKEGGHEWVTDEVAVEEPLEIRVRGRAVATTMRTPGHDEELAAGFLFAEAIIRMQADLQAVAIVNDNVIDMELAPAVKFSPASAERFGTITSSCGLCGKGGIEFIRQRFPLIDFTTDSTRVTEPILLSLPERLRNNQGNFARTGGIHAAGIFELNGHPLVVREDIGRHNAVDKAIGRAFL